jgi:hypothetical protein
MMKVVGLLIAWLLLASCSAGGGAVSAGVIRVQANWAEFGVDRYETVVYPAGGPPMRP